MSIHLFFFFQSRLEGCCAKLSFSLWARQIFRIRICTHVPVKNDCVQGKALWFIEHRDLSDPLRQLRSFNAAWLSPKWIPVIRRGTAQPISSKKKEEWWWWGGGGGHINQHCPCVMFHHWQPNGFSGNLRLIFTKAWRGALAWTFFSAAQVFFFFLFFEMWVNTAASRWLQNDKIPTDNSLRNSVSVGIQSTKWKTPRRAHPH